MRPVRLGSVIGSPADPELFGWRAKLFVNNSNGKIGPVGYWDAVASDELPESYHDSAYLDRLHRYVPGGGGV